LTAPAGKSVIYVIQGRRVRLQTTLQVEQRDVCRLAERTFYRAVLEPGQHQLGVHFEGQWGNGEEIGIAKQLIISAKPDRVYYFWAGVGESDSPRMTGLFQVGLESRVAAFIQQCPDRMGRAAIRDPRNRLTGEIIRPQRSSETPK
jgi:hypothetical protein